MGFTKDRDDQRSSKYRAVILGTGVGEEAMEDSEAIAVHGNNEDTRRKRIEPTPELTTFGGIKLGWIQGVLIPCLLNIWGVMLFLRIAWIVAQAGIGLTIVIIMLSGVVCVITTLSLSAICTNGEIQGGGVYYLVSRSLGAELGASVGIIFAIANAVAASMNTIGFCESLNELLKSHNLKILDNGVNDVRIVGAIALFVMCFICAIGMDWETKTQNFLIAIIVLAIFNYIIGACMGPKNDVQRAQGFVGINSETAMENMLPNFRVSEGEEHNFFSVFAMYFPAVTGVQAGANICGDLKDPAIAIPRGTLLALCISVVSYLVMAVLCGVGALRDASGRVADVAADTVSECKPHCKYGLHHNYEIMQLMALSGSLIYAGCWAATLSTALTNLLSVPRLVQALGVDRIYPGLIFFSKPYGKHGEPYRGYVLTFFVSLLFLLIADLNTIAPLITNFYLASYALINFCTFHAAFIRHISWRPTFQYYNTWLSLAGFIICIIIMMVISWAMALLTLLIFITLYLMVLYRKPKVNWGSSTEAQKYIETVAALVQMYHITETVKSYNPQILVLAGRPFIRPALLDIAQLITNVGSFMIVADINEGKMSFNELEERQCNGARWLRSRKIRGFYVIIDGHGFVEGVRVLLQSAGIGRLTPNIVLLGFRNDWTEVSAELLRIYVRVIQQAFERQVGVTILRVPDFARPDKHVRAPAATAATAATASRTTADMRTQSRVLAVMHADSDIDFPLDTRGSREAYGEEMYRLRQNTGSHMTRDDEQSRLPTPKLSVRRSVTYMPLHFSHYNSLDAWWLYDDGGLNILLPYIIARRGFKDKMPLRIFAFARESQSPEEAEQRMMDLLNKFRIEYASLIMVSDLNKLPSEETIVLFNSLVKNFLTTSPSDVFITEEEITRLRAKTNRYLRLRELLLQNSPDASLIVMTLPVPRKGLVSAALYLAWLEVLSRDLPPMLFIRGNDNCVLDA